jgi:hypothetical protein
VGLLKSSDKHRLDVTAFFDSEPLQECLWEVVQAGAMLTISATKNGAAIGLTVTFDGEWDREWFKDTGDALVWFSELLPELQRQVEARDASGDRRDRRRRPRDG